MFDTFVIRGVPGPFRQAVLRHPRFPRRGAVSALVNASLLMALCCGVARAEGGSAINGELAFHRQCSACHSIEKGENKIGPSLYGVLGRKSAAVADYRYSDALRRLELTWSEDKLDVYLTDSQAFAPGSKMWVKVPQGKARQDIIAFLAASAASAR